MALCCQSNGVKVACVAMREYARRSLLSCAAWRRLPICMRMVVAPGMEIRRGRSSSKASVTSGRFPRSSCKCPSVCCPCYQRGRVGALVCMLYIAAASPSYSVRWVRPCKSLRRLRQYVHVDGGCKRGASGHKSNSKRKQGLRSNQSVGHAPPVR